MNPPAKMGKTMRRMKKGVCNAISIPLVKPARMSKTNPILFRLAISFGPMLQTFVFICGSKTWEIKRSASLLGVCLKMPLS